MGNEYIQLAKTVFKTADNITNNITKAYTAKQKKEERINHDNSLVEIQRITQKSALCMKLAGIPGEVLDTTLSFFETTISKTAEVGIKLLDVTQAMADDTTQIIDTAIQESTKYKIEELKADVEIQRIKADVEKTRITEQSKVLQKLIDSTTEKYNKRIEYLELKEKCLNDIKLKVCEIMDNRLKAIEDMCAKEKNPEQKTELRNLLGKTRTEYNALLKEITNENYNLTDQKELLDFDMNAFTQKAITMTSGM